MNGVAAPSQQEVAAVVNQVAMRAGVVDAPRKATLQEVPVPSPGPGEVLVRLEGCGVCGSNLPVWEGRDWFTYPLEAGAPGHEGWGVVDSAGAGVETSMVGERVAMLSSRAFAEYDVAPVASIVRLPEELAGKPFPGEPLGCAVNIFKRSDIRPGQTVAIVGVGFLGVVLTRLAANAGARVLAIARRPFALDLARQYGADQTILMDDHQRIIERVKELTGGEGCERVIEAVGLQWPLDLAGELTRERSRLIIAGYHQDSPRQVDMQMWNWRGLDVINAHERDPQVYVEGIKEAVELVASGKLDPDPLYTTFPLDNLQGAMEAMRQRPDGFLKALVTTR